ncbi:Involucrin repeat protein, partial [Aspergillus sp. HF37]
MNPHDPRSSLSSYGDPRYLSSASFEPSKPPPAKILLDGYRDALDPQNEQSSRFNPLNPSHPRSSALLDASDPVVMYLLSETAIGDSRNYEVLSLEEVEDLKKEYSFLAGRLDASMRRLALEMKLRDAAKSLSRLYSPKSPRSSDELDPSGSPKSHRNRLSFFGRSSSDKSDDELAVATRKCEDLALEVWKLEHRTQRVHKRLLEHTAGVLQMTHKGLKKNPKSNLPRTPESIYSSNTRGSVDGFDDRSLYRTLDNLDEFGGYDRRGLDGVNGSESSAIGIDAIQNTERKLEMLSGRVRDMVLQSNPDGELDPFPQSSSDGEPANPSATVDAHLAYIENNLGMVGSHPDASRSVEQDNVEKQLADMSSQLHNLMIQCGLSRSPTLPPPDPSSGLHDQLSYLSAVVGSLQSRVDGLLDQKSILTTQIQQQRELNSKSDAERDVHTADIIEQLATTRKELGLSERENQGTREELNLVLDQLESVRSDMAAHEKGQSKDDPDALASEKEARNRAEQNLLRLEFELEQFHSNGNARAEEADAARSQAEDEIARLEAIVEQHRGTDARAEEAAEGRERAEQQVSELEV